MKNIYLAFDLGATSGRAIVGELIDNKISITEVHRFPNNYISINGHLYWNIYNIFDQLQKAIIHLSDDFKASLTSIGIDTWGVDFALLDSDGNIINLPLAYRDSITDGVIEDFSNNVLDVFKLYQLTGIQLLKFNSLFQLYAMKKQSMVSLTNADKLLFIPDLLNYLFTGIKSTEYSIASTSQLLNTADSNWSAQLLKTTQISEELFTEIRQPGSIVGLLHEELAASMGISSIPIVAVAEHDTGSAVVAIPATEGNWAFISSGTWSIMGIETDKAITSSQSYKYGFSNEGGVFGTCRFLKNISGMWLLEQCKKTWNIEISYTELVNISLSAPQFQVFIDPDDSSFANPKDMPEAIKQYCKASNQAMPQSMAHIVRVIFESLALKYRFTMEQLKALSPFPIDRLHIIGGGCHNELLCAFTANALNMPVIAGPAEATAIGNIMIQVYADGRAASLAEIRKIISDSTQLKTYQPTAVRLWDEAYDKFLTIGSRLL